ncbi:hypothetical protein VX159_15285 [Dechloromonas sp. ZY10]|uniref:hypothetical protein n=1 Tax=Dechloromonas aquae TaxID=2664436 RepID=UPI003528BA5C
MLPLLLWAGEPEPLTLNLHGTLGIARTLAAGVAYRPNDAEVQAAGRNWTDRLDNRVGLQASWKVADHWAFTSQWLLHRNGLNEVQGEFPVAYLAWQPSPQFEARLGRIRQVLFLTTDSFDIGYAHPWVRPPAELYTLVGEMTPLEGVQVRYRQPAGSYMATLTAHAARASLQRPTYENTNRRNFGLALTLANPHLTLQAAAVYADAQLQMPAIDRVGQLIAMENPEVAREYLVGTVNGLWYGGLGMRYERAGWLLMSEIGATQLQRISLRDRVGGYLTLGHTWGNWTPYVTYARNRTSSPLQENRLHGPAAQAANALLARRDSNQQSWSLGVRWDFAAGMALKAQWDSVRPETYGLQASPLPAGRSRFEVFSLVMDWAF